MERIYALTTFALLMAVTVNGQRLTPDQRKAKIEAKKKQSAEKKHNRWAPRPLLYLNNITWGFELFTITPYADDLPGLGLGMEYERYVGKQGRISVHMPVYYQASIFHMGLYRQQQAIQRREVTALFAAPGVRYHPFRGRKPFDIAVGGQLAAGQYNTYEFLYETDGTKSNEERGRELMLVPLAELDVTNNPGRKRYLLGLHFAIGPQLATGKVLGTVIQVGFRGGLRF